MHTGKLTLHHTPTLHPHAPPHPSTRTPLPVPTALVSTSACPARTPPFVSNSCRGALPVTLKPGRTGKDAGQRRTE